jgi:hypothetical protein
MGTPNSFQNSYVVGAPFMYLYLKRKPDRKLSTCGLIKYGTGTVYLVRKLKTGGFYGTLLHLPPLRFHCVGGCWDRTQDCYDYGTGSQTL